MSVLADNIDIELQLYPFVAFSNSQPVLSFGQIAQTHKQSQHRNIIILLFGIVAVYPIFRIQFTHSQLHRSVISSELFATHLLFE